MNDIFISYCRKNQIWVSKLVKALEAEGYKVWWDRKIIVGDNCTKEIQNALEHSKCVITVWSRESINSSWVIDETTRAYELNKLLPIRSELVPSPFPFRNLQTANLTSWNGNRHNSEYYQLIKGIKKYSLPNHHKKISGNITSVANYYINHDDDTVLDINTNLTWKRYSEGQDEKPHRNQMIRKYTWREADKRFKQICFAGYNDWRLPTIKELRTLVYCSNGTAKRVASTEGCDISYEINGFCSKPTINQDVFPNTLPYMYWTSSPFYNADYSWALCFNEGYDEDKYKAFHACIRLVRRTAPAS